jgi:sec-independent protein translocase protein TatB
MFDFGFSEVLLTSAIALVVLGPERLPKVARQVGNWMGRARHMARQLSEQLEREVNADELMKAQTQRVSDQRVIAPVTDRTAPAPLALPPMADPQNTPPQAHAHAQYEPPAVPEQPTPLPAQSLPLPAHPQIDPAKPHNE